MKFSHIHHISESHLINFYKEYAPVFVLNTGRSGSALLQDVFKNFTNIDSFHEAIPNLFLYPNFAFHNQSKSDILENIFRAARIELILKSKVADKIYLETNQCLVFFIHQIIQVFPKAKFVHLTRHPGNFVRSAIMKGWHKNDSVWEFGRIKMNETEKWSNLSHIQKLSWVWNETHEFIEEFKTKHRNNIFTVKLENLVKSPKIFNEILDFIDAGKTIDSGEFKRLFNDKRNEIYISPNEPKNMFKLAEYPNYINWSETEKYELKKLTKRLCDLYNYSL